MKMFPTEDKNGFSPYSSFSSQQDDIHQNNGMNQLYKFSQNLKEQQRSQLISMPKMEQSKKLTTKQVEYKNQTHNKITSQREVKYNTTQNHFQIPISGLNINLFKDADHISQKEGILRIQLCSAQKPSKSNIALSPEGISLPYQYLTKAFKPKVDLNSLSKQQSFHSINTSVNFQISEKNPQISIYQKRINFYYDKLDQRSKARKFFYNQSQSKLIANVTIINPKFALQQRNVIKRSNTPSQNIKNSAKLKLLQSLSLRKQSDVKIGVIASRQFKIPLRD